MLLSLSKTYQTIPFYMNLFEAFVTLLCASGFLFASVFMFDIDDVNQQKMATKYAQVGQGFALIWIGFAVPMGIMYKTLYDNLHGPTVAQACTTISVPKSSSSRGRV